jgi:hypothetical protein
VRFPRAARRFSGVARARYSRQVAVAPPTVSPNTLHISPRTTSFM